MSRMGKEEKLLMDETVKSSEEVPGRLCMHHDYPRSRIKSQHIPFSDPSTLILPMISPVGSFSNLYLFQQKFWIQSKLLSASMVIVERMVEFESIRNLSFIITSRGERIRQS